MIIGLLTSSLLILVVLLIRKLCKGHIKPWLQYGLWMLVAIKLIIFPVPWITSSFAILSPSNEMTITSGTTWSQENEPALANLAESDQSDSVMSDTIPTDDNCDQIYSNTTDNSQTAANRNQTTTLTKAEVVRYLKYAGIALWLIGAIAFAIRFVVENLMVRKAFLQRRIKYEQDIVPLEVYTVDNLASPCLFGGKIYARKEFLEDPKMREHVLIHEYCHHLHRDNIWSALRCICIVAYWWNPLVWLAARYSKTDCELACDDAALRKLGEAERINYGRTLINLMSVKGTRYLVLASSMKGSKKSMKDRITVISKKPRIAVSLCVAATIIVCAVLMFTCIIKPGNDSVSANTIGTETKTTEAQTETETMEETNDADAEEGFADYSVCTDKSATEVEAFASNVAQMFANKDWNSLAEVINYPITINDKYYETKQDFLAENWSEIFSQDFIDAVANTDTTNLIAIWSGIGMTEGYVWINEIDGDLYVSTINFYSPDVSFEATPGLSGHWALDYTVTEQYLQENDSLMTMFGTGLQTGSRLDFNDDGTFELAIGLSVYLTGTYEIEGDCVNLTCVDESGNTEEILLTRGDDYVGDGSVPYIIFEYAGDKIFWKKLA